MGATDRIASANGTDSNTCPIDHFSVAETDIAVPVAPEPPTGDRSRSKNTVSSVAKVGLRAAQWDMKNRQRTKI
jgi:hypothetical protein